VVNVHTQKRKMFNVNYRRMQSEEMRPMRSWDSDVKTTYKNGDPGVPYYCSFRK